MIKLLKYLIPEWEYRPNEWGLLTRLKTFRDIFRQTKTSFTEKETNNKLTKDDKGMVVLTQKGENENLTKNIFRLGGGNERSCTLIKPQGNNRVRAQSLPSNFVACNCADNLNLSSFMQYEGPGTWIRIFMTVRIYNKNKNQTFIILWDHVWWFNR